MADTESNENAEPRKGLWALMGQKPDEAKPAGSSTEPVTEASSTAIPVDSTGPSGAKLAGRPKGLWSLMHQAEQTGEGEAESGPSQAAVEPPTPMQDAFAAPIAPLKGADKRLRQLQFIEEPRAAGQAVHEDLESHEAKPAAEAVERSPLSTRTTASGVSVRQVPPALDTRLPGIADLNNPARGSQQPASLVNSGFSRSARWSIILGALSVPISLIAIFPAIWTRVPPSVCGFVALLFGFLGLSEIQRSRGRIRGQSIAYSGMALGLLGMFAGPLIYTPLDVFGQTSDWHTSGHLKQIGAATEIYYQTDHAYPAGGTFHVPKPGVLEPMHGWMTQLLPHLPQGAVLFEQLDLSKPYFDPVNLPVMEHRVPSFLAAGGSQALVQEKYGPAHFAGLGGTVTQDDGSIAHVGVFDINSDVTRDDVADGLSHTMLAGELGHNYPAWGDPQNWRQIGKGLNRDPNGFGNARHSGSLFLMADGSVKYFPNQTDPKVLQALSTRDGDEGF